MNESEFVIRTAKLAAAEAIHDAVHTAVDHARALAELADGIEGAEFLQSIFDVEYIRGAGLHLVNAVESLTKAARPDEGTPTDLVEIYNSMQDGINTGLDAMRKDLLPAAER
jgi:hypothetical protein